MRNLPQKILALLIVILLFLVGFSYYIQKPIPTFKRLVSSTVALDLEDIKLDRYDTKNHPVLFKFTPKGGKSKKLFADLVNTCNAEQITPEQIPETVNRVDKNLVETIKKSKQIFLSKADSSKSCLLFLQEKAIFLYINDKF